MSSLRIEIDAPCSAKDTSEATGLALSAASIGNSVEIPGNVTLQLQELIYRPGIDGTTSQIASFILQFGAGFLSSVAATWLVTWFRSRTEPDVKIDNKQVEELLTYMSVSSHNCGIVIVRRKKMIIEHTKREGTKSD